MGMDLNQLTNVLNKKFGSNVVAIGAGNFLEIERVRTGILALDLALGGGIPRSSIIEFYGRESGGKTTTALITIASFQKQGLKCGILDLEHSFDPAWARVLGVNVDELWISQPDTAEQAIDILDTAVRSRALDLLVFDSLASAVPSEELEKSAFDQQMALQARLFGKLMRKITSGLQPSDIDKEETHNKTSIIFTNQIRESVGFFTKAPEPPGGHAVKHAARIIVEFRLGDWLRDDQKDIFGRVIQFKTTKNKTFKPYMTGTFDLMFDGHIDNDTALIVEAIKHKIISQGGAYYTYGEIKVRGKDVLLDTLRKADRLVEIQELVFDVYQKKLIPKVDDGTGLPKEVLEKKFAPEAPQIETELESGDKP